MITSRDIERKLSDTIGSNVEEFFANVGIKARCRVEYQYENQFVTMFHGIVTFDQKLYYDELMTCATFALRVSTNDGDEYFPGCVIDHRTFVVGDGDDTLSCWASGSQITFWIRDLRD